MAHHYPLPAEKSLTARQHVNMPPADLLTTSTSLQKAVAWIGETMQQHPDKQRGKVIAEAELRFDLTPAECEFLNHNFKDAGC